MACCVAPTSPNPHSDSSESSFSGRCRNDNPSTVNLAALLSRFRRSRGEEKAVPTSSQKKKKCVPQSDKAQPLKKQMFQGACDEVNSKPKPAGLTKKTSGNQLESKRSRKNSKPLVIDLENEKTDPEYSGKEDSDSDSDSDGKYKCSLCKHRFARAWRLKAHMETHTKKPSFKCDFEGCTKSYSYWQHLQRHQNISHCDTVITLSKITCPAPGCGVNLASSLNLKKHFQRFHDESYFKFPCSECGKKFKKHRQLTIHLLEHSKELPHKCEVCHTGSISEAALKKHMKGHQEHHCNVPGCTMTFRNVSLLKKHKIDHKTCFSEMYCAHCEKKFSNRSSLIAHINTHFNGKSEVFRCSYEGCSRVYYQKRNLNHHVRYFHERKSKYMCPWEGCGRPCHTQKKLEIHVNVHKNGIAPPKPSTKPRAKRKDAGKKRRSAAVLLSGFSIPQDQERELLNKKEVDGLEDVVDMEDDIDLNQGVKESLCESSAERPTVNQFCHVRRGEQGCNKEKENKSIQEDVSTLSNIEFQNSVEVGQVQADESMNMTPESMCGNTLKKRSDTQTAESYQGITIDLADAEGCVNDSDVSNIGGISTVPTLKKSGFTSSAEVATLDQSCHVREGKQKCRKEKENEMESIQDTSIDCHSNIDIQNLVKIMQVEARESMNKTPESMCDGSLKGKRGTQTTEGSHGITIYVADAEGCVNGLNVFPNIEDISPLATLEEIKELHFSDSLQSTSQLSSDTVATSINTLVCGQSGVNNSDSFIAVERSAEEATCLGVPASPTPSVSDADVCNNYSLSLCAQTIIEDAGLSTGVKVLLVIPPSETIKEIPVVPDAVFLFKNDKNNTSSMEDELSQSNDFSREEVQKYLESDQEQLQGPSNDNNDNEDNDGSISEENSGESRADDSDSGEDSEYLPEEENGNDFSGDEDDDGEGGDDDQEGDDDEDDDEQDAGDDDDADDDDSEEDGGENGNGNQGEQNENDDNNNSGNGSNCESANESGHQMESDPDDKAHNIGDGSESGLDRSSGRKKDENKLVNTEACSRSQSCSRQNKTTKQPKSPSKSSNKKTVSRGPDRIKVQNRKKTDGEKETIEDRAPQNKSGATNSKRSPNVPKTKEGTSLKKSSTTNSRASRIVLEVNKKASLVKSSATNSGGSRTVSEVNKKASQNKSSATNSKAFPTIPEVKEGTSQKKSSACNLKRYSTNVTVKEGASQKERNVTNFKRSLTVPKVKETQGASADESSDFDVPISKKRKQNVDSEHKAIIQYPPDMKPYVKDYKVCSRFSEEMWLRTLKKASDAGRLMKKIAEID